jgi:arylsulfatase A-like enzyme
MNQTPFKYAAIFLAALSSLVVSQSTFADPPNILHIHADDQRADGLHALGNELLHTPNIDKLVERGTTFTRCYTMGSMIGAVCLPSRTMLLTGRSWLRIPEKRATGDRTSDQDWNPDMSLPRVLASVGYQTFHVGKGGNEFTAGIRAFDKSIVHDDHSEELRRTSSKRHADEVIRFLDARDTSKSFYVYMAPPVPHDPRVAEPDFHKLYDAEKVPLSEAFMPQHPFDNGEMTVRDEKLAPWPRTPADTKQQLADYDACMTGLDYHVGRILETLRSKGLLDSTIVVFSSDNGLSMGEHGLFGKQNLYEFGGMHVPLLIAGPGIPKGRSEALVYLMDLFPTFVEYGGGRMPENVEGRSLRPIIEGKQSSVRNSLYTAYRDCMRAVRDDRWKLIRYPQVNVTQLFDLQNDPHEITNLADKPEQKDKVAEMTAKLESAMQEYGDNAKLVVDNPKPAEWTPPSSAAKNSSSTKKRK